MNLLDLLLQGYSLILSSFLNKRSLDSVVPVRKDLGQYGCEIEACKLKALNFKLPCLIRENPLLNRQALCVGFQVSDA